MKLRSVIQLMRSVRNKFRNLSAEPRIIADPIRDLIANGNLVLGENCVIDGLSIFSFEFKKGVPNVVIGNDCHILGKIELNSADARIVIGDRVAIGPDTKLFCRDAIRIDDDVLVSWGCTFIDTNAHSLKSAERKDDVVDWKNGYQYKKWEVVESRPIHVHSKSWIGFNSIITKGVVLGEGTVVGCGSVVTKSTGNYTVVGGNPAVFIKNTE